MSVETTTAKHAIHDKLESQMKTAEAKLDTLKARAEVAKATLEIKALAELASHKLEIHQKLQELKKTGDTNWEHAKADIEAKILAFERTIKGIEAKVKAH